MNVPSDNHDMIFDVKVLHGELQAGHGAETLLENQPDLF